MDRGTDHRQAGHPMTYTRGRRTTYRGITMRSRLEASFAAWLDGMYQPWEYEPDCFADQTGQYLPDFLVDHGGTTDYYEVKPPTADTSAALHKMHIIRSSQAVTNLYVVVPTGIYPNQKWTIAGRCEATKKCAHCLGAAFHDERTIPSAVGGWKKCSQEETDAFLADRPFQ